ncbi:MAG: winged helix DNA-binding domain-containing protein [Chloroflexi bacterium]|nr:MAG: winged helix DNA-binding domain-containing protein [Chloroflexota bacterium]
MEPFNIVLQRLLNQRLAGKALEKPDEVVRWLGAVQAQDYGAAKWALGLRLDNSTDDAVERAFTNGSILRTHMMRPTWHFVTPADIRWMLALTAPRVHALNGTMYRKLELDSAVFSRSSAVLTAALRGGNPLTRDELRGVLERAGSAAQGVERMAYILMHAELDALICSGPRRGKQFTYMLLDECVPQARNLERGEALAELVRRYFLSHGPATVQDFVWWSGLTVADARTGLEMVKSELVEEGFGGKTFWFSPSAPPARDPAPEACLLPNYDEYGSYQDRSAIFNPANTNRLVFNHFLAVAGQIAGTWQRTLTRRSVVVEIDTFVPLGEPERQAAAEAAESYGAFLGLPVELRLG